LFERESRIKMSCNLLYDDDQLPIIKISFTHTRIKIVRLISSTGNLIRYHIFLFHTPDNLTIFLFSQALPEPNKTTTLFAWSAQLSAQEVVHSEPRLSSPTFPVLEFKEGMVSSWKFSWEAVQRQCQEVSFGFGVVQFAGVVRSLTSSSDCQSALVQSDSEHPLVANPNENHWEITIRSLRMIINN